MQRNSAWRRLSAGTALNSRVLLLALGAGLGLALAPGAAQAQAVSDWNGGSGDWENAANWSDGVPAGTKQGRILGGTADLETQGEASDAVWLMGTSGTARLVIRNGGTLDATVIVGATSGNGELEVSGAGSLLRGVMLETARLDATAKIDVLAGGRISVGVLAMSDTGGVQNINVSGAGSLLAVDTRFTLGAVGAAPSSLQISNGGRVTAREIYAAAGSTITLGTGASLDADIIVRGAASLVAANADAQHFGRAISQEGGVFSLVKNGSGSLELTGDNSYSGATTINAGTLYALGAGRNSIGDQSAVTIAAGAALALEHGGTSVSGMAGDNETIGSLAGAGTVTLGAQTLTVGANNSSTAFSGTIGGTGGLIKIGTGTLTLSGVSTYTGGTTITEGTLRLAVDQALGQGLLTLQGGTLANDGRNQRVAGLTGNGLVDLGNNGYLLTYQDQDTSYAGTVTGTGSAFFHKNGAGTLTLTGNVAGSGVRVDVTGGTLVLANANSYGRGTSVGNGGKILLGNAGALGSGTLYVNRGNGLLEASADLTLANTIEIQKVNLSDTNLVLTGDRDLRLNGTISTSGTAGTGGGLIKQGNGTLTLAGNNSYTGGTLLQAGTLRLLHENALGTGTLSMQGGTTLSLTGFPTIDNALNLAGDVTLSVDPFQSAYLSGAISGAGGIVKTGTGVLTLDGANGFTGNVDIREGTLGVAAPTFGSSNQAIADTARVSVSAGATFSVDDAETIGELTGSGWVSLLYDLTVGGTDTSFTFGGNISGGSPASPLSPTYGLIKTGTGTFTLSGDNDYLSGTQILGGTLAVTGSLDSNYIEIGNGAALAANGTLAAAQVDVRSGGTLYGTGSIAGLVQVNAGGRITGAAGQVLSLGALTLGTGAIMDVSLGAPGTSPLFDVAGDVRLIGTLNVADAGGFGAVGVYRLINYGGTFSGTALTLGTLPAGIERSELSVQTGVAGQVNLVSNHGLTLRFWDGGDLARHDNGVIDGVSGTWTATSRTWTDVNGIANGEMRPAPAFAVFQGAGGTIRIGTGYTPSVSGMQFAVDGYRIQREQIALDGGVFTTIRVGDGTLAGRNMTARIENALVGNSGLLVTDLGTLILSGTNSYTGGTRVDGATLIGSVHSIRGNLENGGTVVFEEEGVQTFAGNITTLGSTGGQMIKRGDGELVLAGTNNLDWQVERGILTADATRFTGNVAIDSGSTLALAAGTAAGNVDYAYALSGAGALRVGGAGTLVLTGDSSGFAGTTSVDATSLRVDGSLGGALDVRSGGTLAGAGQVGATTIGTGSHLLGTSGATLTLASLALDATAQIDVALGAAAAPALFDVTGNLTLDGTLNIADAGSFGAGVYRLFDYGGTLTDNGLVLGTLPGSVSADKLTLQTNVAGRINLLNANGATLALWDGAGPAYDGVIQGGSGTWRTDGNGWTDASGLLNGAYTPSSFAVFQGSGGTVAVDNGAGAIRVAGMQFAADGYSLTGDAVTLDGAAATIRVGDGSAAGAFWSATIANTLTGSASLVKTDLGTLVLTGASDYSGGTTVSAGRLQIGSGGTSGSVTGDIVNQSELVFARSDALIFGGVISGSGALVQAGSGTLTLSGDSSGFSGSTRVADGTLRLAGSLGGAIAVEAGATLAGGSAGSASNATGAVSIADGGHLAGTQGRTLHLGSLSLASGASLDVALGAADGSGALFDVAGDLTLDGTLNVADAGGFGAGVYRLFDYGGTLTDNGLVLGTLPAAIAPEELAVQTSVAGRVNLVSNAGLELAFWDGGNAALHDNGAVDGGGGSWSAAGRNWTSADGVANGAMRPRPGFAVFQGAAGTVTIDNRDGPVSATGMQFAADGYTLAGDPLALSGARATIRVGDGSAAGANMRATIASALTGESTLVKTDLGTLILTGANSYTGGTVVEAGTLIGNAGSIRGDLRNDARTVFDQTADAVFAGNVTGTGTTLKTGAGVLTLTGTSSAAWSVEQGGLVSSTDRFTGNLAVADDASFTFDQSADGIYAGTITGSGAVLFSGGGMVRLTGDSSGFRGATTVADLLSVNGVLTGTLEVLAGGRLQGTGTVGDTRVAGTIAPGNSIGTLTVAGALTLLPGSVYEVEANAAGQSDRIAVDGTAALAGTVRVLAADGNYAPQTDYTILTATGGISGRFTGVTSNLAFLDPALSYGASAVTLRLSRNDVALDDVAVTRNQRAVAPAVNALGYGNAVFNSVLDQSAEGAREAFDALSGVDYANMRAVLIEDSRFLRNAVLARGEERDVEGTALWGRLVGSWGDVDGDGNAAGYERTTEGLLSGFDGAAGEHWRVGAVFGYGTTDMRMGGGSEQHAESYQAGAYASGAYGPITVQIGANYGWHALKSRRAVAYSGFGEILASQYNIRTLQSQSQISWRAELEGVQLQPFAGLAWVRLFDGMVRENGGAAALTSGKDASDTGFATAGLRFSAGRSLGEMGVRLSGAASARRVLSGKLPTVDLAFAGQEERFTVAGAPFGNTAFAADLGLDVDMSRQLSLGVRYAGQFADRGEDHGAHAQLNWRF